MSDKSSLRPAQLGAAHLNASEYSNSKHAELLSRRQKAMGNGVLFYHEPVNLVRGDGVWLFDDQGKKYLDCYNNVASVGHCNPQVVKALTEQAKQLNTHTRYLHENVVKYAEKLISLLPEKLNTCVFTCTGSEANDLAIRMARAHTGKQGLINLESSYHGNTSLVNDASSIAHPVASKRPRDIVAIEPPNTYRGPYRQSTDANPAKAYADLIDGAMHQLNQDGFGSAAFICDTIFDSQGVLEAPKDYFKMVQEKLDREGTLWIADEVQAGMCRTGKWWGFEHYDAVPDIVVLGKPVGNGHPIGVLITTEEIAASFAKSNQFYFSTFAGNPVSAAVGLKVLEECERMNLVDNTRDTGAYLRAGLEKLAQKHHVIGNIRGHGMFIGVDLVHDQQTLKPANDLASKLPDLMKENGVLVGISGRYGNVLKVRPPLVFQKEHADVFLKTLDKVLTAQLSGQSMNGGQGVNAVGNKPLAPKVNTVADNANGQQIADLPKVISERVVAKLHKQGCTSVEIPKHHIVTPLAKEKARSLKMSLVKQQ